MNEIFYSRPNQIVGVIYKNNTTHLNKKEEMFENKVKLKKGTFKIY